MRQVDGGDKKGRLDGGDEFSVGDILLEWIKIEIRAALGRQNHVHEGAWDYEIEYSMLVVEL